MVVASLRGLADLRTGGVDVDQHEVQCSLQCCGEVLVTGSAQSTDIEEQDESAQEVHGPAHFIILGGQNGGGADEENAKGGASAQDDADEVGVKGGFVGVCSSVDDDVPHADPCHQGVEQYQDGSCGQVHGSVIAGAASKPLGKGLGRGFGAGGVGPWGRCCHAAGCGCAGMRPAGRGLPITGLSTHAG